MSSNYFTTFKSEQCNNDKDKYKSGIVSLGERRYNLNKSKCKFVSVGLAFDYGYQPFIKLAGVKGDQINFDETDWKQFVSYQGVISNYVYSYDKTENISDGKFCIHFEQFSNTRVIKIQKDGSYIYLGYETLCKLWELLPLIEYRIDILKRQQFIVYFKVLQRGLKIQNGDFFVNALNTLRPQENPNCENISMVLEFLHLYPEIFEQECRG